MELVVGWLIFSLVAAWIASSKGRSGFGIFILSLLLSPLVGIIVALVMQRQEAQVSQGGVSREFWKCPFCAEAVRFEAVKCKHCGSDLSTPEVAAKRDAAISETNKTFKSQAAVKILLIGTVVVILAIILNQ